jgi:uncharacterized damage-inducible protein DinB
MKKLLQVVMATVLLASYAGAQKNTQQTESAKSPVMDAVRHVLARQQKNLVAAAQEMPADKYSFHPTPPQMSFATLIGHIAESNNLLCSRIGNVEQPKDAEAKESDSKEKLTPALNKSFDFCNEALAKVDDSKLGDQVKIFGGREASKATAAIALTNDWADHYAMAAMYLRLNGMLPPTAKK